MSTNEKSGRLYMLQRAAEELQDGMVVNLGFGLPSEVINYVPADLNIWVHAENGLIGLGGKPEPDQADKDLTTAGAQPATFVPGAATFDTLMSFALIRGGHLDVTMLGGLQVDAQGRLANWVIPGKKVPGMGGAMDLVAGAKRVIVIMEHITKDGEHKIMPKCQFPLTSTRSVDKVITDLGVIVFREGKAYVTEIAPHSSWEEVQEKTGIALIYAPEKE